MFLLPHTALPSSPVQSTRVLVVDGGEHISSSGGEASKVLIPPTIHVPSLCGQVIAATFEPFQINNFCLVCLCCCLICICCTVCALLFFTLDAGLLARSQYSEGPAIGHLDTGISWFLCV